MIEQIVTKMVLDRVCPVCGGLTRFKATRSARTEVIECNACNGKGYISSCTNASALLTPHADRLPLGIQMSMKQQNMLLVDTTKPKELIYTSIRGYWLKRLYTYNVGTEDFAFIEAKRRLLDKPAEIHMYFD